MRLNQHFSKLHFFLGTKSQPQLNFLNSYIGMCNHLTTKTFFTKFIDHFLERLIEKCYHKEKLNVDHSRLGVKGIAEMSVAFGVLVQEVWLYNHCT